MSAADARQPVIREGARVLLVDGEGRLLVMLGHDPHQPARQWWFTPGGGLDPGETARECAVRELREETGLVLDASALVGPVWRRTALFDFMSRPYIQHEVFFVARSADARDEGSTAWTEAEIQTIDEVAWMTEGELAESDLEVFPRELREPWVGFLDWDGALRDMGEVGE